MDELKEAWGQLSARQESIQLSAEEVRLSIDHKSKGLLERLTRKIYFKFIICFIFTLIIGGSIPWVSPIPSQMLLGILFLSYIAGTALLYKEYLFLKKQSLMDSDTLSTLKTFQRRIKKTIYFEELVGLILYPVSAAAGYLFGLQLGNPSVQLLTSTKDWLILIAVIIVITPLGHLAAKWINRLSFGRFLKEVERNIADLESEEVNFEAPKSQNE